MSAMPHTHTPHRQLIAVVGAVGGCGTTSLATLCAVHHQEAGTWLVDLKTASTSEAVLGIENGTGVRWGDLNGSEGLIDMESLAPLCDTYRGVHYIGPSRFDQEEPHPQAVLSILHSLQAGKHHAIVELDATHLTQYKDYFHAIVVVSPMNVLGVCGLLALANLLGNEKPLVLVTTELPSTTLTPRQFERATGQRISAHVPRSRSRMTHIEAGAGPLGAMSPDKKTTRIIKSLLAEVLHHGS